MSDLKLPKGVTIHRDKLRIAFRPPGATKQIRRSLGMVPTKANIKIAEMKLNAIKHDIMLGVFDITKHFPDELESRDQYTVGTALREYRRFVQHDKGVKRSTMDSYESLSRAFDAVGDFNLWGADRTDIVDLRKCVAEQTGRPPAAINRAFWLLQTAVRHAVSNSHLPTDPTQGLRPLLTRSADEEKEASLTDLGVYTMEEADRIIEAMPPGFHKDLVEFLFWTGTRHGEALGVRREDVDLPYLTIRRTVTARRGVTQTPKTGQARRILLPDRAQNAVRRAMLSSTQDYLFARRGRVPNNQTFPRGMWFRVIKNLGLRELKPYTTRHSFISWMLMAGQSEWRIAQHVGHRNTQMIQKVYGHFVPEKDAQWPQFHPTKNDPK